MQTFRITVLASAAALLPAYAFAQTNAPATTTSTARPAQTNTQTNTQTTAPQVNVQPGQANVTVRQPQPEITVHQPAPTVTVDIPQPVITIKMPKPDVNVSMTQPQVSVQQNKPQVTVAQPTQPQVNLQSSQAESDNAPKINYTSEQAKVVVNQSKDAPKINIQRDDQANASTTNSSRSQVSAMSQSGGTQSGGTQPVQASRLMNLNVVNANGDTLGDVEHVLMHTADNKPYVVIGHGGFLGMGEKQVALPIDNMFMRDGKLVMRGMSDDQIKAMPSWTKSTTGFTDFSADQTVPVSTNG